MFLVPKIEDLKTESDVEQKFAWPLLTSARPHGLGYSIAEIFTKPNIKNLKIGKGDSSKLYYPDYVATFSGLPVLIVEAKPSGGDLAAAARECRLYAAELNASYPTQVNPCLYCVVTDGLTTEVRSWDSDDVLAKFALSEVGVVAPAFGDFCRVLASEGLREHAEKIHKASKGGRYYRALTLIGGQTVQSEKIAFNDFGRVLASNFQSIFDPASYDDRLKIVRNAYVGSPQKERYIGEIDRIIRNSSPVAVGEAQLIQDPSHPTEISDRFQKLPSLKNQILLLVGAVGAGKSTFVDYLRDRGLPGDIQNQTAWVRIDLNPAPVTKDEIYPWLRKQIIDGIRLTSPDIDTATLENLKKVYKEQIRIFNQGEGSLFAQTSEQYLTRLADLLSSLKQNESVTIQNLEQFLCTGRGRLLVVVLDNCDKRDRDEQLLMFQVAKYIQQEIRCLVILPLRYETFENHRHEPPLDTALKDLVYRIEPPPFQEVLKRRLGLVVSEAKKLGPNHLIYHFGGNTVKFPVEKLERFLHAMMGALFDHKQYGRKIIIGLAGWNIRKAFEIFLEFCRSGYIRAEDIFERQLTSSQPLGLPHGVVAKVLLRTNRRYYDGDQSFVKNLFQCDPTSSVPCCFLRFWILAWLRAKSGMIGPCGIRGYHRQEQLLRDFLVIGAAPEAVRAEIRYLAKAGCVLPEHLRAESIADDDLISITPGGHVHLELALRDINYLAACSEDAWVASKPLAEAVRSRVTMQPYYNGLSWGNMLANAGDFCAYLKEFQAKVNTALFLPETTIPLETIDFDKILTEIASHHDKFASRHSAEPDLHIMGDPRTTEN